jgi:hypothetical protein
VKLALFLLPGLLAAQSMPFPGPVNNVAAVGPSLVAHTLKDTTNSYPSTSVAINCTGANFVFVAITNYQAAVSSMAISDSLGNSGATFLATTDISYGGGGTFFQGARYLQNITGSSSYTVTLTGGQYGSFDVSCWSGMATSSVLDQQNTNNTIAGASTYQPGSVTPGSNNEVLITWTLDNGGALSSWTIDSGYIIINQTPKGGSGTFGLAVAYLIQSTTAASNPTWTPVGGALTGTAAIATLK